MRIPHEALSPATLHEVIDEFVTRDGTDHSGEKQRVIDVMGLLKSGIAELHFDEETGTCNIVIAANG